MWVETVGIDYETAPIAVHWMLRQDSEQNRSCQAARPPSHPASSLPPTSGPKRREHAVSETRARQVVQGSRCRFCTQNQELIEPAGMLVRPLWYPLTSDTALHACMHAPNYICQSVTWPLCTLQPASLQMYTMENNNGWACTLENNPLHMCTAKSVFTVLHRWKHKDHCSVEYVEMKHAPLCIFITRCLQTDMNKSTPLMLPAEECRVSFSAREHLCERQLSV